MASDTPLKQVQLPSLRNPGTLLRVVALVESMNLASAYVQGRSLSESVTVLMDRAVYVEPLLVIALLGLFVLAGRIGGLSYRHGVAAVLGLVTGAALVWHWVARWLWPSQAALGVGRVLLISACITGVILFYFNWRYRMLSPAIVEARLMALQARIRPHFLFNSLNTVLGLLREDPRRSEAVLENLAELFRALLAEPRTLVPLEKELELARAYIEIEMIRIGPRLEVQWQVANAPMDALVPPMVLQPLVENAVYHGIERSEGGGVLNVIAFEKDGYLTMVVRNPCTTEEAARPGNRMALSNIRERLVLHFDAEAHMSAFRAGEDYVVQIRIPCRRAHHDAQDIHR
jgi:two-component system sensor histidine kinase AlgZ